MNDLNTSLQGRNKNILLKTDNANAFIKKLGIWSISLEKRNFDVFILTSNYFTKNVELEKSVIDRVLESIKPHLRELKIQLLEYFPDGNDDLLEKWVLYPFNKNVATAELPIEIHNKLIEISADKTL